MSCGVPICAWQRWKPEHEEILLPSQDCGLKLVDPKQTHYRPGLVLGCPQVASLDWLALAHLPLHVYWWKQRNWEQDRRSEI